MDDELGDVLVRNSTQVQRVRKPKKIVSKKESKKTSKIV